MSKTRNVLSHSGKVPGYEMNVCGNINLEDWLKAISSHRGHFSGASLRMQASELRIRPGLK